MAESHDLMLFGVLLVAHCTYSDSAVTAVPVTKVDPKLDVLTDEWHKQPKGSFVLEHALYSDTHGQYDATGDTQGLPVGVQVACSLYEEEKVRGLLLHFFLSF